MNPQPPDDEKRGALLVTALWTLVALAAFAGNSVLCRAALISEAGHSPPISPGAFTAVRLLAGAVVLAPFLVRSSGKSLAADLEWKSVVAMVIYAAAFSLSYVTLPAGAGALILFGTVQITMVAAAALGREPIRPLRMVGMLIAFFGLVRLVLGRSPGAGATDSVQSIDPFGAALMAVAGIGWGVYTLRGRGSSSPTRTTALNFAGALPAALLLLAWSFLDGGSPWQARGLWLALASGAVTSGAGYAIWYHALRGHSRTSAAAVQLTVPIIAAVGGTLFLSEPVTRPLVESTILTLGGVALAVYTPATLMPAAVKAER